MELTVTEQTPDRALLVEADTGDYDAQASLAELFELTESAGAIPVASITQRLSRLDPATCVGSGKLEEIRVVNKAKWYLIDNEDMSENDAHKYIEKAAMDSGITKKQAAQMIVEKYS